MSLQEVAPYVQLNMNRLTDGKMIKKEGHDAGIGINLV